MLKRSNLGFRLLIALSTSIGISAHAQSIDEEINTSVPTPMSNYNSQQIWADEISEGGYIWQGFHHEWLRFVFLKGIGRTPHRISKFHNYISQDANFETHANTAQIAGVDGNYMKPKTYYSRLASDSVYQQKGHTSISWVDKITESQNPVAINQIRETIKIPSMPEGQNYTVLLDGIELDLNCDNDLQPAGEPCNSNGIWPYVFQFELENCDSSKNANECRLNVDIYRAWTPNLGAFQFRPFFYEIKPVNHRLSYDLKVHYSVVSGSQDVLRVEEPQNHLTTGTLLTKKSIYEQSIAAPESSTLVTGITGFGFMLSEPKYLNPIWKWLGSDIKNRGRYITKVAFNVDNPEMDENGGWIQVQQQQVKSVATVVSSQATTSLTTQVLAISDAHVEPSMAKSRICNNSTDQAPLYSRWNNCGLKNRFLRRIYGDEQNSDKVSLE